MRVVGLAPLYRALGLAPPLSRAVSRRSIESRATVSRRRCQEDVHETQHPMEWLRTIQIRTM